MKSSTDMDLIFGKNPVLEALQNPKVTIEKVIVQSNLRGELEKEVRSLCKDKGVPISKVPPEKLTFLSKKGNHQGVAAIISPISFQILEDAVMHAYELGKIPLVLVLEGVTDVRNVGAIARSAHVMGACAIVFPQKHAARINEEAVKISAGALLKIPVCREPNMQDILQRCKAMGLAIYATDLASAKPLPDTELNIPCAIVLGSEGEGITLETRRMVDQTILIPQATDFDSLNVSVAAGIVLYEAHRQRS